MSFVDNQVDSRTGTIRARASFDNKDGYLTPGLFARVKLIGHNSHPAVLVDDRAIGTDQSQKFVYVIDSDNKVAYRGVKIGRLKSAGKSAAEPMKHVHVIGAGVMGGDIATWCAARGLTSRCRIAKKNTSRPRWNARANSLRSVIPMRPSASKRSAV